MAFLISLLVLLLYCAFAFLVIYLICSFFEKVFATPVPPRVLQLIYCIVGLIFVIWLVESLATHTPIRFIGYLKF